MVKSTARKKWQKFEGVPRIYAVYFTNEIIIKLGASINKMGRLYKKNMNRPRKTSKRREENLPYAWKIENAQNEGGNGSQCL